MDLIELVGGHDGVRGLIDAFYARVEADVELRSVYPDDLTPGKEKLALFFEQWLGGPPAYSEKYGHPRLRRRHFPFVIAEKHAGLWLKHMREAVQERAIPAEAEREMFEGLAPLAKHMVNAHEDVPREPLGDVRLR